MQLFMWIVFVKYATDDVKVLQRASAGRSWQKQQKNDSEEETYKTRACESIGFLNTIGPAISVVVGRVVTLFYCSR